MLRYLALVLCLVHLSVGGIIRGRVLLNGDVKQSIRVPSGAVLLVRLQDTSVADAPSIDVKQIRLTPLFAFPFTFQLSIPTNASRALPYSMSARITKGETLLYINDQYVPITIGTASPISVDIPVIAVGKEPTNTTEQASLGTDKQLEWPEMVGREGNYAVQYIKEKSGLTNVFTVVEGSPVTMDYRTDRVRIFVNKSGIVTRVPRTG